MTGIKELCLPGKEMSEMNLITIVDFFLCVHTHARTHARTH